jgi:hypothetical protein
MRRAGPVIRRLRPATGSAAEQARPASPAATRRPRTTLEVLFSPDTDTAGALARQILVAEAAGLLGGALKHLPEATRHAACQQAAVHGVPLLDADLIGLIIPGWQAHRDLAIAARRTLAAPGRTERPELAEHRITVDQRPAVSIEAEGRRLVTVRLGLAVDFDVTGLTAQVSAGRLIAFSAGRCDARVTLVIQETDMLTRHAHVDLATLTPASPGLRLLPARAYLVAQEIEDSAARLTSRRAG